MCALLRLRSRLDSGLMEFVLPSMAAVLRRLVDYMSISQSRFHANMVFLFAVSSGVFCNSLQGFVSFGARRVATGYDKKAATLTLPDLEI